MWTRDFIADATVRGGARRLLTLPDAHPRGGPGRRADRALQAKDGLGWLPQALREHGAPAGRRSDHGPESIAAIVPRWLPENGVKTLCLGPGGPGQNGFVESFHGRFRDGGLNREQLPTLTGARGVIGDHRQGHNRHRPP